MSSSKVLGRKALVPIIIILIAAAGIGGYFAAQSAVAPKVQVVTEVKPQPTAEKLKVAVLLPGSVNDFGWNGAMYVATNEMAKELDLDIAIAEGVGQVGVDATLRSFAEKGYKIIFGHTIGHQDAVLRVAPDFPKAFFGCAACWKVGKNVFAYDDVTWEGAYLAGILAGGMSKTGTIGVMGGAKYASSIALTEGYRLGAMTMNPNIKVIRAFAGVWDDVAKGRELTLSMIEQGVDVMLFRGDGITIGGIQAASLKGIKAIGDVTDQSQLDPKTIMSSNMYDMRVYIRQIVKLYREGKLEGKIYSSGIKDGVSYLYSLSAYWKERVPSNVQAQLQKVTDDIKAGRFNAPRITEEQKW